MAQFLFDNQLEKKLYYKVHARDVFKINGMTFADTVDKYEFSTVFLKKNPFIRELILNIEYLDLFKGFEYIKGYTDIAEEMFNINKRLHLILASDDFNMACEIKNLKEISNRWEDYKARLLKNDELKKMLGDKLNEVVESGNKEYNSEKLICKSVNNHILYDTFFRGLFYDISKVGVRHQEQAKCFSRLFMLKPENKISIPLVKTIKVDKQKESSKHMLSIQYKLNRDKLDDKVLLEGMTQYPNLRQRVARYNYQANYRYTFSPETSILESYEFDYFEQINDDLESSRHCKVDLLDDKITKYYE